jgi:cell division protein FtsQ
MSPVAAPADRRFRRAHVKPGRRRQVLRNVVKPAAQYLLVAAAVLYGLYRLTGVAAYAHVLQVNRIVVSGNERLTPGDVVAVIAGLRGQSVVFTDLEAWRQRLIASPWIRDASLRRSLPSTVEVAITERHPVGVGRIRGEMYLVDDRGMVIDQYGPRYADYDLPIIDGLTTRPDDEGGGADEARAELAARVIAALAAKPAIGRRLSQVDVKDLHNATVILNDDPAVIQLGDDRFLQRIESYLELAAALRERVEDIDYVDLRFDDRIYVRPSSAAGKRGRTAARKP